MARPIKILFIHHAVGWGGAPINLINIIRCLDKNKFEPHVLLLRDSVVKNKLQEFGIPYSIASSVFYKKWYRYFSHTEAGGLKSYQIIPLIKMFFCWFLSKYIYAPKELKSLDYDIVHLNSSVLSDWVLPSSRYGKVIYHIQEPISKGVFGIRYQFIRSEVRKYADKIIAISQDNAARINLPQKTEIVYNFTDIPEDTINLNSVKSILYVGGAAKIKGIEVVLKAIPLINKDIQINLAGPFPNLDDKGFFKEWAYRILYPFSFKLRRQIKEISKLENVHILGPIPSIFPVLRNVSLLISPFTVPHFSRPIIEAFAYAKPVIASDVEGMDEIVDNGIDGVIFKNKDYKSLAQTINSLINQPINLKEMGANGHDKALKLFSPKVNNLILEQVYDGLMNK